MTASNHHDQRDRDAAGEVRAQPSIWAMLIPADLARPCVVLRLPLSGIRFSDAIGGGLLDETICSAKTGQEHTVYQDADRDTHHLPHNHRAATLATRLDWPHVEDRLSLRGDILITGIDASGLDTHLPHAVLLSAVRAGLLDGWRISDDANGRRRSQTEEQFSI